MTRHVARSAQRCARFALFAGLLTWVGPVDGLAQTEAPPPSAPANTTGSAQDHPDDLVFNPAQPDFTVVNLPTSLRLAPGKWAFRVSHRFTRSLSDGDFGSLVEDFFGFDGGAQIGLEVRVGLWRGLQAGVYRTSDRTIQFFSNYSVLQQGGSNPVSIDAWLTAEGTNNFRDSYSPGIGAVVSRTFGDVGAVHLVPMWINNTAELPSELVDDNDTFMLGIGGRLRISRTVYLVGEVAPRLAGYAPDDALVSFGIEKRVGGHAFQVNVSNSIGTTMAQVARSFANNDDWFIGFNISRKFY